MGKTRMSQDIKSVILVLLKKEKNRNQWQKSNRVKILKLYALYLEVVQLEKCDKRLWVTNKFSEKSRALFGASMNLIPDLRVNDKKNFFRFVRMSPETFDLLLSLVGPKISPCGKGVRQPIFEKERLELVLHYLATGDLQISNSLLFRISEAATNNFISLVCEAIWETLSPVVFEDPSEDMWKRTAQEFDDQWQFKHCIGAIDGKLIPMEVSYFSCLFQISSHFQRFKNRCYFSVPNIVALISVTTKATTV